MELIRTVRKRFDGVCRQRGFSIDWHFNKECDAICDMAKIQQVVYNLLSNAVNYSGDSREIQVTITAQEGKVRVAVTDHGEGISQEDIPYIWDRYYLSLIHLSRRRPGPVFFRQAPYPHQSGRHPHGPGG